VDDSIQVLKISIKTTGAEDDANFIYPDGTSIKLIIYMQDNVCVTRIIYMMHTIQDYSVL
jgi:hypothetical protein